MITEIVIGKKYKVKNSDYTRTPLYIHNGDVFYEHDYNGFHACSHCCIEDFKRSAEEIPEEWFEVIYRLKNGKHHPTMASHLYSSKADFLNCYKKEETAFEFIKLRKVVL